MEGKDSRREKEEGGIENRKELEDTTGREDNGKRMGKRKRGGTVRKMVSKNGENGENGEKMVKKGEKNCGNSEKLRKMVVKW